MKASHKCPDKLSAQDCQLVITVFKQKIELILEGHLYQILQSFSARKCDFFKKLDLMKRQLRINTSFSLNIIRISRNLKSVPVGIITFCIQFVPGR